ncbi:MAG: GNAT family N-acetyltransferase [Gammaproteobacteria bacterium]|nr:GNAT family N-acetyltransferase [Gammaproteobacteria bacterium]
MTKLKCPVPDLQIVPPRGLSEQLFFRVYSGPTSIAFAELSRPSGQRRNIPTSYDTSGPGVSYCLRNIAVAQNYRTMGVGTALLDEVLEFCRSHRISRLYGEAKGETELLKKWYRSHGFTVDDTDNIEICFEQ